MHITFTEPRPRNYRREHGRRYSNVLTAGMNTKRIEYADHSATLSRDKSGKISPNSTHEGGMDLKSSGESLLKATVSSSNANNSEDISNSSASPMRYQVHPSDADLTGDENPSMCYKAFIFIDYMGLCWFIIYYNFIYYNFKINNYFNFFPDSLRHPQLNISVTMLSRNEALLHWWPEDILTDKDFEVVFMPEHARFVHILLHHKGKSIG